MIGHVLWGKALLQLGKPAQAMEQFERAIGIDKENAHAYNLIGEVLVQRGLFRSALPILRKAAALQPNDGRVKLWLDQTQQALAGGPPPVMADLPGLTANALVPKPEAEEPPPPAEAQPPEEPAPLEEPPPAAERTPFDAPPPDDYDEREEVTAVRSLAELQAQAAALRGEAPSAPAAPSPAPVQAQQAAGEDDGSGRPMPERVEVVYFHKYPPRPPLGDDEDTLPPGETRDGLRQALPPAPEDGAEETTPVGEVAAGGLLPDLDDPDAPGQLPDRAGPPIPEGDEGPHADAGGAPRAGRPSSSGGGLLGDLPSAEEEDGLAAIPAAARVSDGARNAPAARSRTVSGSKRALLDDIPDAVEPQAAASKARTNSGGVDAAAIAAAYEKELREKLAKNAAAPSFLARYGVKLAVGAVVSVVLVVGIGAFIALRAKQGGQTLAEVLDRTERIISQDTGASLREALTLLERAREMDEGNARHLGAEGVLPRAAVRRSRRRAGAPASGARRRWRSRGFAPRTWGSASPRTRWWRDEQAMRIARRAVVDSLEEGSAELHTRSPAACCWRRSSRRRR